MTNLWGQFTEGLVSWSWEAVKKLVGDVQVSEDHHVMLDDAARGTLEKHFTLEKLEIVTSEPEEEVLRRPENVQRDFMLELKQQHVFHGRGDVKRFLDGIKWLGGADGLSGSLPKGLEMAGARQGYFLVEVSESGSFLLGLEHGNQGRREESIMFGQVESCFG